MANWRAPDVIDQSIMRSFSNLIEPQESMNPDLLPNLRNSEALVLASDYSGEAKEHPFLVLAFLLTDIESVQGNWNIDRLSIRKQHLPEGRRLEFKGLNDQRKQKALMPFLSAANTLNGIVLCVAIEKTIDPFAAWIPISNPVTVDADPHNADSWEKLLRIATFAAVLASGLGNHEQEVRWIMDDDNVIANDSLKTSTAVVCRTMFRHFNPSRTGKIYFEAASNFDDDGLAEDLISIVDIAGGATAENIAAIGIEKMPRSTSITIPILNHLSTKTLFINSWLSDLSSRLKKINVTVRQHAEGQMLISMGHTQMRIGEPSFCAPLWTPLAKGWKNSARWW
jgi:hypothetical protein